jgi:hypothetical protein
MNKQDKQHNTESKLLGLVVLTLSILLLTGLGWANAHNWIESYSTAAALGIAGFFGVFKGIAKLLD